MVFWASWVIIDDLCSILLCLLLHSLNSLKRILSIGIPRLLLLLSPSRRVLSELLLLRLRDFTRDFIVETDASKTGIGGELMQDGQPIAYFSKKLGPRMQSASTYIRELFALTKTIAKWRQYLLGRPFVLRTDHKNLKNLLTQVVQIRNNSTF